MAAHPATLHAINDTTGVYVFMRDDQVPANGTYLQGPPPTVGTAGYIIDLADKTQFVFEFGGGPAPSEAYFKKA